jgi:nucleotide-binding universal stress UspA family protein
MFSKILLPVDLEATGLAAKAVATAVEQARMSDGELHVITVIPGFGLPIVASFFPEDAMEDAVQSVNRELQAFVADNIPGDVEVRLEVVEGHPAEAILGYAAQIGADLVVVPSHTRSLTKRVLGSCAANLVQHAGCPVLVIRQPGP